jgi:hypothetical protein
MSIRSVLVAVSALKAIILLADPTIRIYLGDSAAYLFGALDSGRLPDDRSFTYSFLIRGLVRPFEDLMALVAWQTAAGVAIALVAWIVLVYLFSAPRVIAAVACTLLAIEPAQLYYERMVLAETFGLLAFVLFFACAGGYLVWPRAWLLPIVAALGLAAATLRLNYLPIVLVVSLGLPLVRVFERSRPRAFATVRHLAIAAVSVAVLHLTFQQWVAWIFIAPRGYIARSGFMQLGLVMPLVKPEHLVQVGLPANFADQLQYPLDDPDARMRHMWSVGGFVRALRERNIPVESIARPLARLALSDNPLGLVTLGIHTVGDYFREEGIRHALDNDLGRRNIPDDVMWSLREQWRYDASGLPSKVTLVSWYFEKGTWWLVACLFLLGPAAVANIVVHWRTRARPMALLAGLVGVGLVLAHVLFVPVAFYRYLHPLPFFLLVNALPAAATARAASQRATTSHA